MTGKDLILYILNNNLEDEPVFKDGHFLGFLSIAQFAEKHRVGEETVRLWVNFGYVESVIVYDEVYIPCNASIKYS
jgi:hypothetical protein